MKLPRFLKSILAAFAFSVPNFFYGKAEDDEEGIKTVGETQSKFVPGGTLETDKQRQQKQYTIAGGPGSDNIYARFDALPEAERQAMIDARKGKIIRVGIDDVDRPPQQSVRRGGTDAIANALRNRYNRDGKGRLVPKEEFLHDAEAYAKPRVVDAKQGEKK